ncbi:uncharacterized protein JCM6883_003886 [Sporobolomyces salmoneus]|uniref:uncharacterized protein n=1 Tax=Sporobolomyces salmoneus TaxID=183962 RepID=UPI00317C39C8
MPEPIELYQYDLSNGMAQSLGPMLIGRPIEGIWHTSIVLFGVEIWFGQGIHSKSPPGTTHHGAPRKRIPMGETHLDRDTFFEYIEGMRETYKAERYHLLEFNCNHFTNDVVGFLNGRTIPFEILNQPKELMATPFGQQMRPMIEQMFVGANNRSAGDAVNNILPSLASGSAPSNASQSRDDVPSGQSLASNLQIVTSISSLRSTLSRSPATSIMFTSASCPPCNAIKPYFEDLARTHRKTTLCLVETGIGEGAEIARTKEFGGPVMATPTFVFFKGGEVVGECKGADRKELETRIGMLELEVFPPHPHEKLTLLHLSKLTKTLSPITFTSFPPLPALSSKLVSSTSTLSPKDSSVLTKDVISYLSSLPVPPSPAPTTPFPSTLLEPWLSSTLVALESLSNPSDKFPILDLLRLALARDATRLTSQPKFIEFLPKLLRILAKDLDQTCPSHPYLLTTSKFLSNLLISPISTGEILSNRECLENVTKLSIRALLDEEDEKMRSFGAGFGWSLVAKVYQQRIGEEGAEAVGEEWESEFGGALLEALTREEKSLEVVHRLTATLGLLIFKSAYHEELKSLLQVLEAKDTLSKKRSLVEQLGEAGKDTKEIIGVIGDVEKLLD